MASAKSRNPRAVVAEIAGILLLAAAALLTVAMATYHADDPSWWVNRSGSPRNWVGPTGANLSRAVFEALGLSAILMPIALALLGGLLVVRRGLAGLQPSWMRAGGLVVVLLSFAALLAALFPAEVRFRGGSLGPGGVLGAILYRVLAQRVGGFGAFLLSGCGIALGLILSTRFSLSHTAALASRPLRGLAQALRVRWARAKENLRKARARRAVLRKHMREQKRRQREDRRMAAASGRPAPAPPVPAAIPTAASARPPARPIVLDEGTEGPIEPTGAAGGGAAAATAARRRSPDSPVVPRRAPPQQQPLPLAPPEPRETPPSAIRLPALDLLTPPPAESPVDERELIERARVITDKLREFAVDGQVTQIHPGPVVTTFEFKPEPGIKYSRIISLVEDLSMALQAESIRVDRIPGKSTVGIEVPNPTKETIHLRDIIGSTAFAASRSRLTLALGKTIDGEPYVTDLERMPHLLIAGSTGSGKSVGLNCMVTSILYKATPDEVRFILIDPKMLELGVYADIPHLLIPVVTDMKKASLALQWAAREMENRYRVLASTGVRNIEQFNALLRRDPGRTRRNERTGAEEPLRPLPFIVVVIDELADLMMVASVEVEESITRLAQMARAVGIHLVLATQRPSVDVITGVIKANFPARIAFRASQRVDSRTILDCSGAEALLGRGDMLFLPPGSSRLIRVHGALVTEGETARIVEFLRGQSKPAYDEAVLREPEEASEEGGVAFDEKDEMYDSAVRLVVTSGQASISHLQRRLRLGYARAARIVDMMEDEGIVSPGEGAKPRDVLVGPEFLERLEQMAEEER